MKNNYGYISTICIVIGCEGLLINSDILQQSITPTTLIVCLLIVCLRIHFYKAIIAKYLN